MKKTGVLSFLVFALIFILLSKIAFAQKDREGDFLHIYGKDIESWNEAMDAIVRSVMSLPRILVNMKFLWKTGILLTTLAVFIILSLR